MYEAPGYGYWRSHPYLEDRLELARSEAATLEASKNPPDATEYRQKTQQAFLSLLPTEKEDPQKRQLRQMALDAYPYGGQARELRQWFIHEAETEENKKEPFFRDYGKLVQLYERNIAQVKKEAEGTATLEIQVGQKTVSETKKDPEAAAFLDKLQKSLEDIQKQQESVKPLYDSVFAQQTFDTDMLRRYLSNFPNDPRIPEIQFRLAESYRILKKYNDAVDLYLKNLSAPADSEWKTKSKESLLAALPNLDDLATCYKISQQTKDVDLINASDARTKTLAESFNDLKVGYEFRRNYPRSPYDKVVLAQMNKLASDTMHQAKLYQAIGEYQKALDGYNKILRYCADLPIADEVKSTIVDFQAAQSNKNVPSM